MLLGGLTLLMQTYILDISQTYPVMDTHYADINNAPIDTVKIGVVSRFPSNVIYRGYQPLMDYMSANSDFYFELVVSKSYEETVQHLAEGFVQAAFLGTFIYTESKEMFDLIPIIKPLNSQGEPFFRSVVVVKERSDIFEIEDLKQKRLALPSEQSYSGNWLLNSGFSRFGLSQSDLLDIQFFQHHHTVIYELMRDNFDAGAVKDRVAQEFEGQGIRIIAESELIPSSPLVVLKNSNDQIQSIIIDLLLNLDLSSSENQQLLANIDPEFRFGFTRAQAEDYLTLSN